jgi:hypothetical protein
MVFRHARRFTLKGSDPLWQKVENMGKRVSTEERVFDDFEKLSKKHKKEVVDFIAYLKVKEELEATKEIIKDKDFLESILKGDEDFRTGRYKKWAEVREDI